METNESIGRNFITDLKRVIVGLQKEYKDKGSISPKEIDKLSIYWNVYMNHLIKGKIPSGNKNFQEVI
ncbi:MAG: hypothetical protein LBT43_18530 [Prevotella sp.]|jgi:hypothetical protein|nr:hypothetical protein [Prevotella sp.]